MMSDKQLAERLAQLAWAAYTNDRETLNALRKIIEAGGGTWKEDGEQVTCMGISGIRAGFAPGYTDPVASFVVIALLLFGKLWPQLSFADLGLKMVNKKWAEERKNKTKKEGENDGQSRGQS